MKRVGILGAGQLAQLLSSEADKLEVDTLCYAEHSDFPAKSHSEIFTGEINDQKRLLEFASQVDVITLENENIFEHSLDFLSKICEVLPSRQALYISQDRLFEKQLFNKLDIPTVEYRVVTQLDDVVNFSYPSILKTRTLGYDGKGQVRLKSSSDLSQALMLIEQCPVIIEQMLDFDLELSQIATRSRHGEIVFYPLIENIHQDGILRTSICPLVDNSLSKQARQHITKVLHELNYVGTLAFEFFVKDNILFANEIAPRVHNSGHLTIEATNCSQFENHLRAVCDLALITPKLQFPVKMHNVIGSWPVNGETANALNIYNYGKSARPGRKLGHWIEHLID